ncbi:ABC transporter ATP-binding protein [Rhizobium laguerreae]|uniref:ABC transporter ATP-binding protein n=1 Tax=Rhizobium laguerreae TaxID=1076926 RepID=UPI00144290F8|nr:ABC transporter ATP-binding protein [Rhizobium laguerreae]NKN09602.1 ATP-binding cassette domain-containing protein [Rhizobium laguerreae]
MSSIRIADVSKSYGPVQVLKGLSLDVADGEFISFLGPSGCGKSTLLYCIAGLETITEGQILFDERDATRTSPRDRNIALVFQDYALYPHMAVKDNLAFPLRRQRIDEATIKRQVDWASEVLGIVALLDRFPSELSGGQRQRVAVGRAIVRNPAALLMDEPLSNLDASLRVRMRTEIRRLQRELKITTIFVTHDQEEAMVMSDRIAVMNGGKLQQFGTPMQVYRKPANRFVASFIGSPEMNFIPQTALGAAGVANCIVGIRPHDLVLAEGNGSSGVPLEGELLLIESVGPLHFLDVLVGGTLIKATCKDLGELAVGRRVSLIAPEEHLHRFDVETGLRLGS